MIPRTDVDAVLQRLAVLADPSRIAGMARYGIGAGEVLCVTVAELRTLAHGPDFRPWRADGMDKVKAGLTSLAELCRVLA